MEKLKIKLIKFFRKIRNNWKKRLGKAKPQVTRIVKERQKEANDAKKAATNVKKAASKKKKPTAKRSVSRSKRKK